MSKRLERLPIGPSRLFPRPPQEKKVFYHSRALPLFQPVNKLEESLIKATTDPSHRPQFYRDLLASDIYLFTDKGNSGPGERIGPGTRSTPVNIKSWTYPDGLWLPSFTSKQRMDESPDQSSPYIRINTKAIFDWARGYNITLNPHQAYGKLLPKEEIKELLDGSLIDEADTRTDWLYVLSFIRLGKPMGYPFELVDAFASLCAKHDTVEAAYLLLHTAPPQMPSYYDIHIVISDKEAEANSLDEKYGQSLVYEASDVIDEIEPGSVNIVFAPSSSVDLNDDLTRRRLETAEPFYVKPAN